MEYKTIDQTIGNTPLIKLQRLNPNPTNTILLKLEGNNPAGSVKDRAAYNMINQAEKHGEISKGDTLIEATSGNTGIALAFVAAARGYGITLTMPNTMSLERRKLLTALGAKVELTDGAKGMGGAIAKAQELKDSNPEKYVLLGQFDNPANPKIHEETTGPEIWNDTDGNVDIFIAGVGTGGTLTGTSRYIKLTKGKAITTVAVEPTDSPVITQALAGQELTPGPHKIQGIGAGFIPGNLDLEMVDAVEQVSNDDAFAMAHRLMKEEGILAGISSGAAVVAAKRLAQLPENKGKNIVVVLPSSAERYLSSALFSESFSDKELVQ